MKTILAWTALFATMGLSKHFTVGERPEPIRKRGL